MLLGVAKVELDLGAVAMDAVDPLRGHLRFSGEEGHRADIRLRGGVGVQGEDHPQLALEGLADQLRMVQPLALVRQVGDTGAVEAAGVLARQAGAGHPQDGVAAQLAHEFKAPFLQGPRPWANSRSGCPRRSPRCRSGGPRSRASSSS